MELLFSYGTLQQANVQIANFGRKLKGKPDRLPHYRVGKLRITDPRVLAESGKAFHPILEYTGSPQDQVKGTVFELSTQELLQADNYEVDEYQRISAVLASGLKCWIYAAAK